MTSSKEHEFTLVYLPTPKELTPEQEEHWWHELEVAERKVEYAKRMLKIGRFAVGGEVELGLDG